MIFGLIVRVVMQVEVRSHLPAFGCLRMAAFPGLPACYTKGEQMSYLMQRSGRRRAILSFSFLKCH